MAASAKLKTPPKPKVNLDEIVNWGVDQNDPANPRSFAHLKSVIKFLDCSGGECGSNSLSSIKSLGTSASDCQERLMKLEAKAAKERKKTDHGGMKGLGENSTVRSGNPQALSQCQTARPLPFDKTTSEDIHVLNGEFEGSHCSPGTFKQEREIYTVSYQAIISHGADSIVIPIKGNDVLGREKNVIRDTMDKIWRWTGQTEFRDDVGLQDAYDLAWKIDQGDETWRDA